jgi:hypothetical protein
MQYRAVSRLLTALLRPGDRPYRCLFPGEGRKWLADRQTDAIDPHVWSGRALQEDFAELAVSGLASMYPASDWSMWCSGPSWISARVRSR